ncbi:MAG TPA: dehydrogenase [Treponema sp.]|nr:dehydrogenase [Treponema sp.]
MSRIQEHPILGTYEKGKEVHFSFDGKDFTGFEGESIAAALKANGIMIHRYTSRKHKPRGIFCAIGRCTDCVMIVNGQPNVRTCITELSEGMTIQTQYGVVPEEKCGWIAG